LSEIDLCRRCVLPSTFPGVAFDDGICNFCAQSPDADGLRARRGDLAAAMRQIIEERRRSAEYDCVVAFSGGKDSTYTLMMLVRELDLRCLAVTIDNGFISPQAMANCKAVTSALGVDLVVYAPSFGFMKNMYVESIRNEELHPKAAIKRASSICNSCINLINNHMLKTAVRYQIPMIAGGYVGGQVPKDAAILRIDLARQRRQQEIVVQRKVAALGPDAARHFDLGPDVASGMTELVILNPMLTVAISEEAIIQAIAPLGWQRTLDTGLNSSNCRLNDLGISLHHRKHRFHPYVFEISEQIRSGAMTREAGLRKVGDIPSLSNLSGQLEKLQLNAASL
jgi:hypothetical protein